MCFSLTVVYLNNPENNNLTLFFLFVLILISVLVADYNIFGIKGKKLKFLITYAYFFLFSIVISTTFYTYGVFSKKCRIYLVSLICSVVSFVLSRIINSFNHNHLGMLTVLSIFIFICFTCNIKVDKIYYFLLFGAIIILTITSISKKHYENYFWITAVSSIFVTLLFIVTINVYPEKPVESSGDQTNTSVSSTIETTVNSTKVSVSGKAVEANNISVPVPTAKKYTKTQKNNDNTFSAFMQNSNINFYLIFAISILTLLLITFFLLVFRYIKKSRTIKANFNSLDCNQQCVIIYQRICSLDLQIDEKINRVLNKAQFSKYGINKSELNEMLDYYNKQRGDLLGKSNPIKRIYLKYIKIV